VYQIASDSVTFSHLKGDLRCSVSITGEISSPITRCIVELRTSTVSVGHNCCRNPMPFRCIVALLG